MSPAVDTPVGPTTREKGITMTYAPGNEWTRFGRGNEWTRCQGNEWIRRGNEWDRRRGNEWTR
ncbi:hypothetical protein G3I59_08840 [Amycolatopsis rubida]|uniref:Uncharacterized protein n=2 Tax=Amycolatopsis rubida TaxID=112413 RepID=A0ABX0BQU5_9PSEU|nr:MULTISPECIES: hypothetical protein [Amycolatopsis]MYW90714.1 hypothetical protein [Amycolatopsis rubida]NEC55697.1 hypothetical protein [Amycolatopsis rubida]